MNNNNSATPQFPSSVMQAHDPNDDPFASLSDDSNQLPSPLEYGSGIKFVTKKDIPEISPLESSNENKEVVDDKDSKEKQKGEEKTTTEESSA